MSESISGSSLDVLTTVTNISDGVVGDCMSNASPRMLETIGKVRTASQYILLGASVVVVGAAAVSVLTRKR